MPGFMVAGIGDASRDSNVHALGNEEFYYSYTWEIPNLFVNQSGGYPYSAYPPLIYLRDATLPSIIINKELVMGASLEYKFAKSVSYDDVRVVWYDTSGLINIIRQWREMVWTPERGIKPPNEYKRDTYLTTYLPSGRSPVTYKLVNSWPSTIRHGDLTYTSSDAKIVEVVITYDWAYENIAQDDRGNSGSRSASSGYVDAWDLRRDR